MRNPSEEYDRLHDHCQALGRERDALKREVERLHICLESEQWRIRTLTDQICQLEEGTL
jgi:hypothetical protein